MPKQSLLWVLTIILFITGIALVYKGWRSLEHTTILVEWTTASELDTVGYNLYRSERPGEPGERVNPEMIPASSDPLSGGSYKFEDHNVQAGVKYYYSLEEVESSGSVNQAGTIEVNANRSGWWELGLALLLLVSSRTVFNWAVSHRRKI